MLSKKEIIFARLTILLTVGLIFLFQADYVQAQEQKTKKPIQVMVLGTFHFTGVPDFYPIKAPERQEEIEAVVDKLKQFNPSKVALEYQRKHHAKLDSMYEEYLEGIHELTVNERQQLGFRTAKQLNH
ncbi:DUF5694 domain-containing protein, partial [Gracilimonas sp.]|uniref:DUF5694 domain-containing protein n=1 Tax=Gracilimonas sp. TaxID=1974203 RepID=UPI00287128C9|nr:DUF5694 domain-containing protein [Gracilimonas sp.]